MQPINTTFTTGNNIPQISSSQATSSEAPTPHKLSTQFLSSENKSGTNLSLFDEPGSHQIERFFTPEFLATAHGQKIFLLTQDMYKVSITESTTPEGKRFLNVEDTNLEAPGDEPICTLSKDFCNYFGTEHFYDKSKSEHDNVVATIIKNDGYFPFMPGKELSLPLMDLHFSDAKNLIIHFPENVEVSSSFFGVKEVHIKKGRIFAKEADINLFVTSQNATGRALISGSTVTAMDGARAVAGNGGTAIAIDKKSKVIKEPDDYHADTRLEAKEAGTTIIEYVGVADQYLYATTKDNYVCIGDTPIEKGIYENN